METPSSQSLHSQAQLPIEIEEAVPVTTVLTPEQYIYEKGGTLASVLILLFIISKWFQLPALIGSAITFMRTQTKANERLIQTSNQVFDRLQIIDQTGKNVNLNYDEILKIRRILEELEFKIDSLLERVSYYTVISGDIKKENKNSRQND